jgi:hypothetical protein
MLVAAIPQNLFYRGFGDDSPTTLNKVIEKWIFWA